MAGALGVVFGDIGTSPLYAFREAIEHQNLDVTRTNAMGVASLAFWALLVIISVKYLAVVMKAHNHGEGGIFSLLSLVPRSLSDRPSREKITLTILAILGAGAAFATGDATAAQAIQLSFTALLAAFLRDGMR